jgi:hypothetical protein
LLRSADVIIWLDHLPWSVAIWRVIIRYFRLGLTKQPGKIKWRRIVWCKFASWYLYPRYAASFIHLIAELRRWACAHFRGPKYRAPAYAVDYTLHDSSAAELYLQPYGHKLLHCRTSSDVEEVLHRVQQRQMPDLGFYSAGAVPVLQSGS